MHSKRHRPWLVAVIVTASLVGVLGPLGEPADAEPIPGYCVGVEPPPPSPWGGGFVCTPRPW